MYSLVAQMLENLPAVQETWVRSLDWEDPLEKGMATHSSLKGYSPWGRKESDTTELLAALGLSCCTGLSCPTTCGILAL